MNYNIPKNILRKVTGLKLSFLVLIFSFQSYSQNTENGNWQFMGKLDLNDNALWAVDLLENTYVSSDDVLNKYDSAGILKFSQSIKSLGHIKSLQPVNVMKFMTFSEEQQTLCFFDNTLTINENCIDLSSYSLGLVTNVCSSSQTDKIWVIDQLNNSLIQINFRLNGQNQEVKNTKGILDMSEIISIKERNNILYVFDTNGKLYQFDLYGTLLKINQFATSTDFDIQGSDCVLLQGDKLLYFNFQTNESKLVTLPEMNIESFKISHYIYYFKQGDKLLKYKYKLPSN